MIKVDQYQAYQKTLCSRRAFSTGDNPAVGDFPEYSQEVL